MSVTRLPGVTLIVDGGRLAAQAVRSLGEVWVRQRLSLPSQCELAFFDPPGPLDEAERMLPGTSLQVRVEEQSVPLFSGEVTAQEYVYGPSGRQELRVRAYDLLHRLRKRQPVRVHVDITQVDLARELVADLGLSVESAQTGPLWRRLIQYDRDDLQLLADVAARSGSYLTVHEGVLRMVTLAGDGEPVPLVLGQSLLEARVDVSSEAAMHTVQVGGWNPLQVEAYQARAGTPRSGRRVAAETPPERVGGSGQGNYTGRAVADNRHAEMLAQAELDRHTAHEVTFWGIAGGNTRLRPGAVVDVEGLATSVTGRYVLTAVTHTINGEHGFVSELSTLPPPPAANLSRPAIAAFGVVVQVNDPRRLGRVVVRMPGYGDVETDWMQVLLPGAGPDKGLMVIPEVGDRVLVLFPNGDAGEGVVLGGLYGMRGAPDSGVEGNAVRRYTLRTQGGQQVQMDDAENILRLEDSAGSYVELSPQHMVLHAEHDLTLEAPGRKVVIRGQAIDFQRA